ncbi:MAG: Asp-tRNA(Asn)/Glu-tRNA(Gln) amidotransferase subunit GatC [Bifidobacteriaceae bacterium]|jgi:aspartyl-tRNA(Asn)/glutamyl-tRNA(Gln) amidotransferase subunit C|nr:Asp-tRNA(Asn)/Glu-tRNA(Gln) amidotransferase subunit GatC [Bifidobacteriaceae bacterium]
MTTISRQEVARVADLARIALTPEELDRMAAQLGVIVEAVRTVSEAAGGEVPATSHPIPLVNVFRPDVPHPSLSVDEALQSAPEREADQFKVPQILGEEP